MLACCLLACVSDAPDEDPQQGQALLHSGVESPSMGQSALSSASWQQAAAGQVAAPLMEFLVFRARPATSETGPPSPSVPTSLIPLLRCWHRALLLAGCSRLNKLRWQAATD